MNEYVKEYINPVIYNIMIVVSDGWCHMRMRPARLVSYAFLYTTPISLAAPFQSAETAIQLEDPDTRQNGSSRVNKSMAVDEDILQTLQSSQTPVLSLT